jgi:ribose transport system substrate-binding protein
MRKPGYLGAIAACVFALSFAACGDDEDEGGGGSAGGTESAAATESGGGGIVAEAKAAVEKAKTTGKEWAGPTSSPPAAKDKLVHVITCSPDTEGCQRHVNGAVEAAKAIGWRVKRVETKGSPQEFVQTMNEAMDAGADAIIGGSFPHAAITPALKRATKEGVPVVTMIGGNWPLADGVGNGKAGLITDVDTNNETIGQMAAEFAIADTDGKATIGILDEKDFPVLRGRIKGFEDTIAKCTECKIKETVNVPVTVLAKEGAPSVAQFVRANPDVNYFFASYDGGAVFAVQGIKQAGSDVPLVGQDANQPNYGFIRKGDVQVATAGTSHEWIGWAAIDQLNRVFNGEEPAKEWTPEGGGIPPRLFDKTNLPPEGEVWEPEVDFRAEFKKLWGAS